MDQIKDNDELRDRAHKICCEHLGGAWLKVSPEEMSFTPVTGGMSNQLFRCSLPDDIESSTGQPSQALLRLYGESSRESDMSLQVQIFELLSDCELGPKLYGNFDDGRLEEFLPANSLTCDELMNREVSSIIARKLATIHSLTVPNMGKDNNWIMDRFDEWSKFIESNRPLTQYPEGSCRESTRKIANSLLSIDFAKEIKFMKNVFEGTKSPIVFSHNDLHQGNILLVKPSKRRLQLDKRVIFIDFEYCSYNYRGYDIANHFSEWCFEYDTPEYPHFALYMDRFPSCDIQREFIRNYLDQKKRICSEGKSSNPEVTPVAATTINNNRLNTHNSNKCCHSGTSNNVDSSKMNNGFCHASNKIAGDIEFSNGHHYQRSAINHHCTEGPSAIGKALRLEATEFDKEVEAILNEVVPFCMAANLVWTLWCIKSAYSSNIKFGYWEHAMTRWQIYSSLKQSYIIDRTTKRIRTPLKTTMANGHSISSPQLTAASTTTFDVSS